MADDLLPVCGECGKIEAGPEKGQHVPDWPTEPEEWKDRWGRTQRTKRVPTEYKGQQITHTLCEDCAAKKSGQAQDRPHVWFRKPGG